MKLKTTTFIGYSYDASYYINNDTSFYQHCNILFDPLGDALKLQADSILEKLKAEYGSDLQIVSCSIDPFFAQADYSPDEGDCIEYSFIY